MGTPLILDATPRDIRVHASALELRNRKAMMDSLDHNRRVDAAKRRKASEVIDRAAEVGAEYIHKASHTTRTVRLEDHIRHYHPNE